MKTNCALLMLFAVLSTACNTKKFELELTPDGKQIHRQLSIADQAENPKFSARDLELLKQFYPAYTNKITEIKPEPAELHFPFLLNQDLDPAVRAEMLKQREKALTKKGTRHTWSGVFADTMPGEFGGFGKFHSFSNSMGSVSLYMERYSGSDDIAGQIENSWKAIDVLVDHLVGWLDTQIKQEKGFPALRQFLDNNFRRDLKNLRLYLFQLKTSGLLDQGEVSERAQQELFARFTLYLVERGYFKVANLPAMMKNAANAERAREKNPDDAEFIEKMWVVDQLLRFVAGKMHVPETDPLPKFLASLKIPENLESLRESFFEHFRTTEYYRNQLKRNQKENKQIQEKLNNAIEQDRDLQQKIKQIKELHPENGLLASLALSQLYLKHNLPQLRTTAPKSVYDKLIETATGSIPFFSGDRLKVKINLPIKPLVSNGRWLGRNDVPEGEKRKSTAPGMVWEGALDKQGENNINGLPAFCYAVWVHPNERFQKEHFGEVVLDDENLVGYCLWHASLTKEEAEEWNGFTAKLKPSTLEEQFERRNLSENLSRIIDSGWWGSFPGKSDEE